MDIQMQATETPVKSVILHPSPTGQSQKAKATDEAPEQNPVFEIHTVTSQLEQVSHTFNKKLKFEVIPQSHEVIVKVIDPLTDKVIKVLPPEELRLLHNQIREMIGLLFDEHI
ncbi:MAG: flagellar protein FlaG [Treponema sp.]|jgi:flagellar protein FlaG|nr:flagellar protein FlaG [Treponema sp.]